MPLELFIAARYLRAKRKQAVVSVISAISVLGVAAGVAALTLALAFSSGMREDIQNKILGATAHVSLITQDSSGIADHDQLVQRLARVQGVIGVASSIYGQVYLSGDLRDQGAIVKGIDPVQEARVSDLVGNIVEGDLKRLSHRDAGVPGIVLGEQLARQLGATTGDIVRAATMQGGKLSPLGVVPRVKTFEVVAVFSSGLWDYDANWCYVSQDAARALIHIEPDRVNAVEMKVDDADRAEEVAQRVREASGGQHLVKTWIELNRPLFSALKLEKLAMSMAIGLIVLVASLNIVTTLTLMVMEKNRDIAIVTAMGGTSRTVMAVFMLQGLIIGLIGTLAGAGFGVAACWVLDKYRLIRLEPEVYAIHYVPFRVHYGDLTLVCAVAILISFLATLYPARAAARLDPVEALRYE